jgi:polysaccharide export outer membrane protein
MRIVFLSGIVLAAAGGILPPGRLSAQLSDPPGTGSFVLGPGDVVRITVWRRPELSGEFAVAADSSIAHPLYRAVKVAGLPAATVEGRLREFLTRFEENPQLVIEPLLRVAVSGEVRLPSLYMLRPSTSIAQAIAQAGGYTERGRPESVLLVRNGRRLVLDLTRPETRQGQMPIRSGDEIVVEQRQSFFRNVIVPAATILGATASVVIAVRRYHH